MSAEGSGRGHARAECKLRNVARKTAHELKEFAAVFVYFAVILAGFNVYERLVLSEHAVDYVGVGISLGEALVLAKVVLLAESTGIGERFRDRPLIVPTLYKSLALCFAVLVVMGLEHFLKGLIHGQSPAAVWAALRKGGWKQPVARAVLVAVALVPFCALREVGRQLMGGDAPLRELFVRRPRGPKSGAPAPA
jgi:hypothetical protein